MQKTHTFSYYTKERTAVLVPRAWWKLWARDTIRVQETWVRKDISLDVSEAAILEQASASQWRSPTGSLLAKILEANNGAHMLQIETAPQPTPYVATNGGVYKTEPARTNLMRHSSADGFASWAR